MSTHAEDWRILGAPAERAMWKRLRPPTWRQIEDWYASFLEILHEACYPDGMERWINERVDSQSRRV